MSCNLISGNDRMSCSLMSENGRGMTTNTNIIQIETNVTWIEGKPSRCGRAQSATELFKIM